MKLHIFIFTIISTWSTVSFGQNWIANQCRFAVTFDQSAGTCSAGNRILCIIYGVNAASTSNEQRGCILTSISEESMQYDPPVPVAYLESPSDVMADGFCDGRAILHLLFGKKLLLLGGVPLLVAFKNTADLQRDWQMRVVHDETDSFTNIQRYSAIFGIAVSK